MQKQLSLWPIQEESSQVLEIWQALDHDQRQQVTMALAHLLRKIVCPEKEEQTKGATNEQQ